MIDIYALTRALGGDGMMVAETDDEVARITVVNGRPIVVIKLKYVVSAEEVHRSLRHEFDSEEHAV